MKKTAPALRFENLTLGYGRHPAIHHVTGEVARGELLAIVGPNGAGKSTLLKGIAGELKPLSGRIDLDGFTRRDIAYLPQVIEIDHSFPISVFDCVAMGLWREIGAWRGLGRAGERRVAEALATVGLVELADRVVGSLSGGQFQRVLFARLMLQDARVILLDEPFRAVDTKTVADLIALIEGWHRKGRTVLAALHDMEQVRACFSRTLLIARDVVDWGETQSVLSAENLAKSRQLTEAFDAHADVCERDDHFRKIA